MQYMPQYYGYNDLEGVQALYAGFSVRGFVVQSLCFICVVDSQVEVIVGVTVTVCVCVAALIIMMLVVFIKKYQRRKDYDILSD